MAKNTLPIKTFNFSYTSDIDDTTYTGAFTVRRKVISDEATIRVRQIQLNGGYHYDPSEPGQGMDPYTNGLNYYIASIQTLVLSAPEWFDLDNLFDANLVVKLYDEVKSFQDSFRKPKPVFNGFSTGGSSSTPVVTNESGSTEDLVVPQIHASLEPR